VTIYLPIAEIAVNMFLILGIGVTVGFISGMFGVGGGFLMTPLLIFSGIPPAVAVASQASQIAASSFSAALSATRKKLLDVKLGLVLLSGGVVGSLLGVLAFSALKDSGQLAAFIAVSYVLLLGTVGALMLRESVGQLARRGKGAAPPPTRRAGQHGALSRLPLQMKFPRSGLAISAIPVVGLGFFIGFVGSILGIGGGFILVPALIYLLRVPTQIVVGTSQFQMVVTMSAAALLHAGITRAVDVVLALILMIGGAIGAQYGAAAGQKMKSEELRVALALLILAVAARFALDLVLEPSERFSVTIGRLLG
jgi:uncharacterized protein